MIKLKILFLFMLFASIIIGQDELEVKFSWKKDATNILIEGINYSSVPTLENSYFDGDSFKLIEYFPISSNMSPRLIVKNFQISPISETDKKAIQFYQLKVENEIQFDVKVVGERGLKKGAIEIFPYLKEGSTIYRIESIIFEKQITPIFQAKSGHEFAENSVLRSGSGSWYKIRVQQDGVHRISYSFLKDMGIDVDNINPSNINIYGNGFGKLPENNSDFRPDDLLKNAIYIEGEQDGSFDQNDFILFYGRGPDKWEDSGSAGFRQTRNVYARYTSYYININTSEPSKRIENAELSTDAPTHIVNSYNSFAVHEQELVNLIKGGQRWYGERFDAQLSQDFSFSIPNLIPSEPARVRAFMACRDGSATGTNFEIRHNNSLLGSASFGISGLGSWDRKSVFTAPGSFNLTGSNFSINVRFNRQNPSDLAYLDFIEINTRSSLLVSGNQTIFRDKNAVGTGNISEFFVGNFPQGGQIWEITELANPKKVDQNPSAGVFQFTVNTDSLRTFIAFNNSGYLTPSFEKQVQHQNLHALPAADYLIVSNELFISQANRLANLHRDQGMTVHVVELEALYNEFSGGTQDPTAIKFFAKMFFDRAEGDPDLMPKYLLLFGDGTYDPLDRVPNNNYMCPVYHTVNSEGYVSTLISDDYFGFLDEGEGFSPSDILDVAVGRLIATTREHATDLVNKIEHYMKNGSSLYSSSGVDCGDDGFISKHGDWRLRYTTIGDDGDNSYFLVNDLEPAYEYVRNNHPEMNPNKIYSDAFTRVITAGGPRFPDVNKEINRSVSSGTLLMCYVGHGGPTGAAQERIITTNQINDWRNIDRLTLFVSATCEFARIDDNERVSAGEWMALNPIGGAIALMTTTRAVFFSTNSITTSRFFENVFLRDSDEKPRTFGEIITSTKNAIPGGSNNKRAFMLLGDPALRIALPYEEVILDSLNGNDINIQNDTIRALSKARFSGHIEDQFGNELTNFNGIMQPSVFDKVTLESTLGQTSDSPVVQFEQQKNVLYRGRVTVTNGKFSYEFIVPKDINYAFGPGKASFYAFDEQDVSAGGYSEDFLIGGVDTSGVDDNEGPQIELFLNSEDFVNGGITNETPILIAKLFDESGINTVGTGIGHDITAIIDEETSNPIVLNEFYEADLDTYKSGSLRYQIDQLEAGNHTLTFKAWDVNNNSSEVTVEFIVQEEQNVALRNVLNYPNPFTTSTMFMFEHNQACRYLETQVEIFTVTGRLIKTIRQDVQTQGFRAEGIPWDGKDDFGDPLGKGVYVYRVKVRTPDGETAEAMQKLYLL